MRVFPGLFYVVISALLGIRLVHIAGYSSRTAFIFIDEAVTFALREFIFVRRVFSELTGTLLWGVVAVCMRPRGVLSWMPDLLEPATG
ncbi:hypothetical protein BDQ12DRAFT_267419 [Crucibulum laeve]|uniref:Uncharacterized protein n=1 Tax=Crucibulum laeve TaxID=68775 RepID=A0A5C3LUV0_9AGAR|nr:hypothetical protein BDQ12DRAFT_267419 [Crucibulum laeve]